jgi:hypothetical protein
VLSFTDQSIHDALAGLLTLCAVAYLLYLLLSWLRRSRLDLAIGAPIAVGAGVRVLAAIGVTSTGLGSSLRGGDESFFLATAENISNTSFLGPQWTEALTSELFNFVFAGQMLALDSSEATLRIMQAGIAMVGIILLAIAVYELAGARAAMIAAWILALEPTNVFFSTFLHKEPNMMLAEGLVAYGGAMMWKNAHPRWLWAITVGCLIAVATRPYAGWFLIAAGAAITLHVGIRARSQASRSLALVAVVVLLGAISAPTVWEASTDKSLETNIQSSQDANTSDDSNLRLERVDFSTREKVIVNLPQRISDLALRPYPWQLGNLSQQLGVMGTLVAVAVLILLARELWRARGQIMERAGPLVYVGSLLLIAYSLSVGNAGTGFRYRTQVVAIAVCLLVVLRELRTRPAVEPEPVAVPGREPAAARPSLAGA